MVPDRIGAPAHMISLIIHDQRGGGERHRSDAGDERGHRPHGHVPASRARPHRRRPARPRRPPGLGRRPAASWPSPPLPATARRIPPPSGTSPTAAPSPGSASTPSTTTPPTWSPTSPPRSPTGTCSTPRTSASSRARGARPSSSWCRRCSRSSTTAAPFVLVLDDVHLLRDRRGPGRARLASSRASPADGVVALLSRTHARRSGWPGDASPTRWSSSGPTTSPSRVDDAGRVFSGLGVAVPADRLAEVVERCEGWAGGIHLAALAVRDRDGDPAAITGRNRLVADYLVEEVLNGLDDDTARFLEEASILEPMSAAAPRRRPRSRRLRAAARGGGGHRQPLPDRPRRRPGVVPLPPPLRRAAHLPTRPARPRPDWSALHRRASEVLEAHDDLDRAIHHAIGAGDRPTGRRPRAAPGGDAHLRRPARRAGPTPRPPRRVDGRRAPPTARSPWPGPPSPTATSPGSGPRWRAPSSSTTRAPSPTAPARSTVALALIAGIIGEGGLEGVMRNTTFVIESGGPEVNPWWGMALAVQGTALMQLGRYQEARTALLTSVGQVHRIPGFEAGALLMLGWLHLRDGDLAHRVELRRRRAPRRRPPRARPRRPPAGRLRHRLAHRGPHRRHRPGPPRRRRRQHLPGPPRRGLPPHPRLRPPAPGRDRARPPERRRGPAPPERGPPGPPPAPARPTRSPPSSTGSRRSSPRARPARTSPSPRSPRPSAGSSRCSRPTSRSPRSRPSCT